MGLLSIVSSFGTVSSVIIKAFDTNKALAKVLNKYLTKHFPPISFNAFCFGCVFCFAVGVCVCVCVCVYVAMPHSVWDLNSPTRD